MARSVTLADFYGREAGLAELEERTSAPVQQAPTSAGPAREPVPSLLTPSQKQALKEGLAAARTAQRLAQFAGVQVTPVKVVGVALAALAAFGGYKWYKSRGRKRPKRRIKNSLLGG